MFIQNREENKNSQGSSFNLKISVILTG